MVSAPDWMLSFMLLAVFLLVFFQGQDIKKLEKILRIQNTINEAQNKKIEDLRMGRNFVPAQPGIDEGILYDPQKQR